MTAPTEHKRHRLKYVATLNDEALWVITDGVINDDTGERYATTLLLPEEY